jgi:hypothetical protein
MKMSMQLLMLLLIQVVTLLGTLAVAMRAVPVSGIEESYGHVAVAPIAFSHAPSLEISHAPVAIAHAPVIKEVEPQVSMHCAKLNALEMGLYKQRVRTESSVLFQMYLTNCFGVFCTACRFECSQSTVQMLHCIQI